MLKPALVLSSLALMASFATAHAQNGMMMKEGSTMMLMPDGHMTTMSAPDKMMSDMVMKDGKVMSSPAIVTMSGGKVYMMEDKKMPDGKMMSEHMMTK